MPTLEITTTIGCRLACTYCPQDKLKAAYGNGRRILTFADFKTILAKVPPYVRIDFSGMSEPWLNDSCTAMLGHALSEGFNVAIFTTLVGMSDPEAVTELLRLYRSKIEIVMIHLPDGHGNMRGFVPSPQHGEAVAAFRKLHKESAIQDLRWMLMSLDPADWGGNDRAGSLSDKMRIRPVNHQTPVSCSYTPFYDQNVLLPNGDVVLCCMDYGLKHKIGNLLTDDYYAMFASAEMGRLRAENTKCGGDGSICKRCDRATRYEVSPGFKQFWQAA